MTARHYLALAFGIVVSIAVAIASVIAFWVGIALAALVLVVLRLHKPRVLVPHPDDMVDITSRVREL